MVAATLTSEYRSSTNGRRGCIQADLWIAGFGTFEGLDVASFFEPLEPLLLLPDVKDPKTWLNGYLWYDAKDRRIFAPYL